LEKFAMEQKALSFDLIERRANRRNNLHMTRKTENIVGPIIEARLRELDKSQKWLANEVGVDPVSVHNWIRKGTIARENVGPTALALQLTVDQLMGIERRDEPAHQEAAPVRMSLQWLRPDEQEILELYRQCTPEGKGMVRAVTKGAPKSPALETRNAA
jgi:hypothetical protein